MEAYWNQIDKRLEDWEKRLEAIPVPRRVGFCSFREGWRGWIKLIFGQGIFFFLIHGCLTWGVPGLAQDFGKQGSGRVAKIEKLGDFISLEVQYQSGRQTFWGRAKARASNLPTFQVGDPVDFHYLPFLPFWIGLDGDTNLLQVTAVLAPFYCPIILAGYLFLLYSLWREYRLFRVGEAFKCEIQDFRQDYRSRSTAAVKFTCGGKACQKRFPISSFWGGRWALVLANPHWPRDNRVYLKPASTIFRALDQGFPFSN
ncbi:MAG TPA: hypothetical protein VMU88_00580 [bacterium]|nr:hypothetical protein [bacterium]